MVRSVRLAGIYDYFARYRDDMPYIVPDDELSGELKQASGARRRDAVTVGDTPVTTPTGAAGTGSSHDTEGDTTIADTTGAPPVFGSRGAGSNSWVVSGLLTASGKPILANDTHLGIQMPSTFYEIGLIPSMQTGIPTPPRRTAFRSGDSPLPVYRGS